MSDVSPTKHVKSARKNHVCDWCYTSIDQRAPYKTWFEFGEAVTSRMHPECYEAMQKAELYDYELPPAGTFRKGCWCGEKEELCLCKN